MIDRRRQFRIVGILSISQLMGWGTTYDMLGILGRTIAADLKLANEIVFFGLSIMMLVTALMGPFVGRLLARFGAAPVLAAGSSGIALGLALLAHVEGLIGYIAVWIIIGIGAGMALASAPYAAIVERDRSHSRQTIALLMIGSGISAAIFWPVLNSLNLAFGWRNTCTIAAAAQFILAVPLSLFALPKRMPQGGESGAISASPPLPLSAADYRRAFVLIAATTSASALVLFGITPSLHEILLQSGASAATALQLGSLRAVFGISARLGDAIFGKKSTPVLTAIAAAALTLAGLAALAMSFGTYPMLFLFIALYGTGTGIASLARNLLPLSFFSARDYGLQSSRLILPQSLMSAAAPVIFTALLDRGGVAFCILAATLILAFALVCLLLLARLEQRATLLTREANLP